jgi:hypothetical protein
VIPGSSNQIHQIHDAKHAIGHRIQSLGVGQWGAIGAAVTPAVATTHYGQHSKYLMGEHSQRRNVLIRQAGLRPHPFYSIVGAVSQVAYGAEVTIRRPTTRLLNNDF